VQSAGRVVDPLRKQPWQPMSAATVTTVTGLAQAVGATRKSLRSWFTRPDFPGSHAGPWDVAEVEAYLASNHLGKHRLNGPTPPRASKATPPTPPTTATISDGDVPPGVGAVDPNDLHQLKCRKTAEEIKKLALDNMEREGKLSDPTDQIRLFSLAVQSIDRGLDELVMRVAPKVVGCKDEVDAKLLVEEEVARLKIQLGDFRCD
jgi:hypothetical protein